MAEIEVGGGNMPTRGIGVLVDKAERGEQEDEEDVAFTGERR